MRAAQLGGINLENRDYESILNAMPETGVYVIRASDHEILYLNKRACEASREARPGASCSALWTGSCGGCPLSGMEDRQQYRSIGYNESYGGLVDVTAARTLWGDGVPAFVLTVVPRADGNGRDCRKILRLDLERDACAVLKSDSEGWQPAEGDPFSVQTESFARSGAIYPEDAERFEAFTRPAQLRAAVQGGRALQNFFYRLRTETGFRWNLMEVVPDGGGAALLRVKDVHDALQNGWEREGLSPRWQELIRSLGEQNSHIYTIDLNSGTADPIRTEDLREAPLPESWEALTAHIAKQIHPSYRSEFQRRFSLDGLRRKRESGQEKVGLLCQREIGGTYRYISVTAYFGQSRQASRYAVLTIQDVDGRMRREFAHSQRDMQMAAILKSRFKMMNTVDLATGQCERVNLSLPAGPENSLCGDYVHYTQRALDNVVHPGDAESFRSLLSLEHLREKAALVEDFDEEVCLYRQRGEPVRWIELRIIYTRQEDQVTVNILGQDVTRAKCQEDSRQQDLEDRAAVISSLSSLFFSTYFVNLEQDSLRAVVQLRRVGDVLGEDVNCTAALQIYANHFIHPEDREEYLRVMNVQHWRETLRWWQPYVEVEYRKLPDEPGKDRASWVRATAALAQTGPDDMPQTVVYVAQDITASRRRLEESGTIHGEGG